MIGFVLTSTLLSRRKLILPLDSLNFPSCLSTQEWDWSFKVKSVHWSPCFGWSNSSSLWSCQPQGQRTGFHVSGHDHVVNTQTNQPAVTYFSWSHREFKFAIILHRCYLSHLPFSTRNQQLLSSSLLFFNVHFSSSFAGTESNFEQLQIKRQSQLLCIDCCSFWQTSSLI